MATVFTCLFALTMGQLSALGFTARPVDKAEDELYFSPQKGSTWAYDVNGKEETHEVVSVKQKGGSKIVDVEVRDVKGKIADKLQYEINETGIVQLEAKTIDLMHPKTNTRLLLLPSKINQQWEANIGNQLKSKYCDQGLETIQVNKHKYRTIRIEESYPSIYYKEPIKKNYWYAPNVGLVKKVVSLPTEERPINTMILKSFINGKK